MFENLSGLAMGIITFAIIIGVGVIVLEKFGESVAGCSTDKTYNVSSGTAYCSNATSSTALSGSSGGGVTAYLGNQMGQSGLAGWAPAIIAFAVGILFLGYFMGKSRTRKA